MSHYDMVFLGGLRPEDSCRPCGGRAGCGSPGAGGQPAISPRAGDGPAGGRGGSRRPGPGPAAGTRRSRHASGRPRRTRSRRSRPRMRSCPQQRARLPFLGLSSAAGGSPRPLRRLFAFRRARAWRSTGHSQVFAATARHRPPTVGQHVASSLLASILDDPSIGLALRLRPLDVGHGRCGGRLPISLTDRRRNPSGRDRDARRGRSRSRGSPALFISGSVEVAHGIRARSDRPAGEQAGTPRQDLLGACAGEGGYPGPVGHGDRRAKRPQIRHFRP